jgi:dimethylhistidine N-methyltransferase/ergothioneine biosynthesis protein EgtC
MCRHLAYVGPPASLRSLLIDPPHSLYRQAWAPRQQRHGTVNADGFGIGWYAAADPVPARYRRSVPIWGDPSLPDIARVTRSGAVLAAVRSATAGTALGEAAAAPFGHGPWLFSHNGRLDGWPGAAAVIADRAPAAGGTGIGAAALLSLEAMVDSAFLWALVLERLRAGCPMGAALAQTITAVEAADGTGRFNFLLTDGHSIAATACGDTLWYRQTNGDTTPAAAVVVASEPFDDEPGWAQVPDRNLLIATARGVTAQPLGAGTRQHRRDPHLMTTIENRLPADYRAASLRADARAGLTATPKTLPPKWFYDAQGSELFEKITELPEYYPTRAERSILQAVAPEIAALTGATALVELGSGSSEKTRLLLSALRDAGTLRRYVPVDVSESALVAAGDALAAEYPDLAVHAVVADFEQYLGVSSGDADVTVNGDDGEGPRLVAFLGSTIGNMVPAERAVFLRRARARLRPGDAFLLGTDLVKDPAVLVAAYDDAAGVTAAFNKNVLSVLNAELGADFDLDAFDHVAVWDPEREWIEMRLRATSAQPVRVNGLGLTISFASGEEMRTEVSAKFREAGVRAELAAAGLAMRSWWTDEEGRFGLSVSFPA